MFFILTELMYINLLTNNYISTPIVVAISIITLLVSTLVIYIFIKILIEAKKEAENKLLLEQYELEHEYSKELNKILDNLRILKHDLKNHISCMWGLVETDNIDDFKLYLSNLMDELDGYDEDAMAINIVRNKE